MSTLESPVGYPITRHPPYGGSRRMFSLPRRPRIPRATSRPLKPSGRGGAFRDALLRELADYLASLAGVLCHASELRQLRRHAAHLTLVQLCDARNHLAEAVRVLNPE